MIEEAWFSFLLSEKHGFKDIPKREGKRSNLFKNWKQVFGRGHTDKWKESSLCSSRATIQTEGISPVGQRKPQSWEKVVTSDKCAPFFSRATLMEGSEWVGCGELGGGSEAGTGGWRRRLLGQPAWPWPQTSAEQLSGLADLAFVPGPSLSLLCVRRTGAPASLGCCED